MSTKLIDEFNEEELIKALNIFAKFVLECDGKSPDNWALRENSTYGLRLHFRPVILSTLGQGLLWVSLSNKIAENERSTLVENKLFWSPSKDKGADKSKYNKNKISSFNGYCNLKYLNTELEEIITKYQNLFIDELQSQNDNLRADTKEEHEQFHEKFIKDYVGIKIPKPAYFK